MLGATKNSRLFEGDEALRKVAREIGKETAFSSTTVGVYFGRMNITDPDPYFGEKGPECTECNHYGACITGCPNN